MRKQMLAMIEREAAKHSPERPGRIIAKMNSLVDLDMIRALYAASKKAVQIDLIVRGMCCLRPGVEDLSENIRVMSIVGRFLEHSRIFYFQNAGEEEIYIGSADWMARNLDRRIEVIVPIREPALLKSLRRDVLELMLKDNCQSWDLQADGKSSSSHRRHKTPQFPNGATRRPHLVNPGGFTPWIHVLRQCDPLMSIRV